MLLLKYKLQKTQIGDFGKNVIMIKLVAFDIDGTLAEVGCPILDKNVILLRKIEEKGVKIIISSGKSIYYQMGMFRQVGLKDPIFIGENGCCIAIGSSLPPDTLHLPIPPSYAEQRANILSEITSRYAGRFWLQPNEVVLTFFFKDEETRHLLRQYFSSPPPSVTVYEHIDSFDIVPKGIDKFVSLEAVCNYLGILPTECIAVGDGMNDFPMIKFCKYSIGVGKLAPKYTTYHFNTICERLHQILQMVEQ